MAILFILTCVAMIAGAGLLVLSLLRWGFRKVVEKFEPSKTYLEYERLTPAEMEVFRYQRCPDCGGQVWPGPRGGMSVNYLCQTDGCGSKFNYEGPFGVTRITNASPKKVVDISPRLGPYRS